MKKNTGAGRRQRIRRGAEDRQVVFIRVGGPGDPRWRKKEQYALAKRHAWIGVLLAICAGLAVLAMLLLQKLNGL